MASVKICDGRTVLYQWDTGVRLEMCGCSRVTECHFVTSEGVIKRDVVDNVCDVPDAALKQAGKLIVYAFSRTEDEGTTRHEFRLAVYSRPKPADYIDTPDEYDNLEELAKRVVSLIPGGGGSVTPEQIQQAVDNYLAENPVQVEETDPTVPGWAKAEQKPTYTAEEVGAQPKGDYALKSDIPAVPAHYTLPVASADTLGGVKVGEGLSIAEDGTLRTLSDGESEGEYELIEAITLDEDTKRIVRTEDLNGNEYNLSSLFVFIKFPFAEETKDYGYLNVQLDTKTIKRAYAQYATATKASVSTTQQLVATVYAKIKGGVSDGKNTVAMSNSLSADDRQTGVATIYVGKEKYNRVACESGTAFPAGTTIEIWGVRA